jgi:hypothetical protein
VSLNKLISHISAFTNKLKNTYNHKSRGVQIIKLSKKGGVDSASGLKAQPTRWVHTKKNSVNQKCFSVARARNFTFYDRQISFKWDLTATIISQTALVRSIKRPRFKLVKKERNTMGCLLRRGRHFRWLFRSPELTKTSPNQANHTWFCSFFHKDFKYAISFQRNYYRKAKTKQIKFPNQNTNSRFSTNWSKTANQKA